MKIQHGAAQIEHLWKTSKSKNYAIRIIFQENKFAYMREHLKENIILNIYQLNIFNKGAVIFNAEYQSGRKLPGVWKLQQLGYRSMKSIGSQRQGYENLFNNSSKRPRSAKTAGKFLTGYETFQARFEERNLLTF